MTLATAELNKLSEVARSLMTKGKGLLAADESDATCKVRFTSINVPCTEETRRDYREMLFTTPGIGKFISGIILFDETIRQASLENVPFVEILRKSGIIPGIKVDAGTVPLPNAPGETITEGLDGLAERLKDYHELGARFAKWRAKFAIATALPSDYALRCNAHALGRYAATCQAAGIVPIVEPEILMDGHHSIEACYETTERVLHYVFRELYDQRVALEGMLLKPNMIVAGNTSKSQNDIKKLASLTLRCLLNNVPAAVPGIVFLSGGQSEVVATAHLAEIANQSERNPWNMSFSFSRALQSSALKAWGGNRDNFSEGQKAFYYRSELNSKASIRQSD